MTAYMTLVISVVFLYVWAIAREPLKGYLEKDFDGLWGTALVVGMILSAIMLVANGQMIFEVESELLLKKETITRWEYTYQTLEKEVKTFEELQSKYEYENKAMRLKLSQMKALLNNDEVK